MSADPTQVLEPDRSTVTAAPAPADPPRLAAGLELMGQMEDSGFAEAPYLVRRADGQVVQLPQILYALAESLQHGGGYETVAARATEATGVQIEPDDARFLVEEKLAPLRLLDRATAPAAEAEERRRPGDDLLALTWKAQIVPERASRAITALFRPLFLPPVVFTLVAAFLAFDAWLFFSHGVSQPIRAVLYAPALLLVLFAAVILATAFHEIGHATACRYGGAQPGVMGVGLYVIWPVFYTDVTSAYGLDRRGRLRTDLGGVYFTSIFALVCGGVFLATRWEPVLLVVVVLSFAIVQQLLPLGRLDGYLILTDLTGVPDLLGRMKPILRSAVPGRRGDSEVRDLKPWVRRVATGYVLLLVPVLALIVVMMVIHAPRVFATAYDSVGVRWDGVRAAFGAGHVGTGFGELLQCGALVVPGLGMTVSTGRVGRRLGAAALGWSAGAPLRRGLVVAGVAGTAGLAAWTWWPNGDYRPIQPGEHGTLQGGVKAIAAIPTGRPSLTAQRQRQLNGAPFERDASRTPGGPGPSKHSGNGSAAPKTRSGKTGTKTTTAPADTTPTGTSTTPSDSGTSTTTTPTTTDTGAQTTPTTTDTNTQTTPTDTTTTPTDTTTSPTP